VANTATALAFASYNDIFNLDADGVRIEEIPLAELHAPENHPFQVNDDAAMERLVESVREYGVREPGLARPILGAGSSCASYELLCGNRRKRAAEIIGLSTLPVVIRELDDDAATLAMVDSNLQQREKILPSEKSWAYKLKLDALYHSSKKSERHSFEVVCEQTGESKNQIFRLIRLTELICPLIDKVDARQLAFNPAVELSYLTIPEQTAVAEAMVKYDVKPSLSQAVRLKKLRQAGTLTLELIDSILAEEKKPPKREATGSMRFRKFFPPDYSPKQIEAVIIGLLTDWKKAGAVL
jgi:ParB family chromosome partitioning protein